ncbi:hypothetical protein ACQKMN_04010 [Ureibacillus composti]
MAIIEEMSGHRTNVEDPFVEGFNDHSYEELYDIQKEYIVKVKEV